MEFDCFVILMRVKGQNEMLRLNAHKKLNGHVWEGINSVNSYYRVGLWNIIILNSWIFHSLQLLKISKHILFLIQHLGKAYTYSST